MIPIPLIVGRTPAGGLEREVQRATRALVSLMPMVIVIGVSVRGVEAERRLRARCRGGGGGERAHGDGQAVVHRLPVAAATRAMFSGGAASRDGTALERR